jgi:bacillopeptidase F
MSLEFTVGKTVDRAPGTRTYIGQLQGTPNFDRPSLMPRGAERKVAVANELLRVNQNALTKAAPTLDALKGAGLITSYEVNPLSNTVVIDVPEDRAAEAWKQINQVEAMGRVVRNREVHLAPIETGVEGAALVQPQAGRKVEWNVDKVGAPALWEQGITGEGITVGIIDTGVAFEHPALSSKYRGTGTDGAVDHNYNWFDAVNGRKVAYDDNKHGTHVAGTVLGSTTETDGTQRFTGAAPGAKWIASKILSGSGSGTLEGGPKGLEWMLAPRDANGQNPDPKKAPDIVSNSWGTNSGKMDTFRNITAAFNAAGIVPVFAAGNAGPRPGTVGAPGSYPDVISVGATDSNDKIASFSSRGPSPMKGTDGSDRKPDVSAPGKDITSSIPGGGYASFSGTSMATPLTSGVIALLLSKHKDLTNEEVTKVLQQSALDLGTAGYDYDYGYGRIDAGKALAAADALVAARPKA